MIEEAWHCAGLLFVWNEKVPRQYALSGDADYPYRSSREK